MSSLIRAAGLSLVCSVFVFGCGGGDPSPTPPGPAPQTIDEFLASYARGLCEKMRECGDAWATAYTQAECEALVVADFSEDPAVTSGALALDPEAAQGCLALMAASPACDASGASDDYCLEEGGALVGTAIAGSACDSDESWLCAPGTECSAAPFSGACGTCLAVPVVGAGEPCVSTANCLQTATVLTYCDFDPVDGRNECIPWTAGYVAAVGETCANGEAVCAAGAQCDYVAEKCVAQIAIGAECVPYGDLGCVGDAPCVEDAASSLGGVCRAVVVARSVGAECGLVGTDFVECSLADGLVCDPATQLCASSLEAGLDESCLDLPCAAGLQCDYASDTCVALLADGQACAFGSDCLSGFCFGPDGSAICGDAASVQTACAP